MSVPGERAEDKMRTPVPGAGLLGELGIGVTVRDAARVAGDRAGTGTVVLETTQHDDPVEVMLEGEVRLYLPAAEVVALLAPPAARGAARKDVVPLAPGLPIGGDTRGTSAWAIKGMRLIGIDLAGRTAAQVAKVIDERLVPQPGLHFWDGGKTLIPAQTLPEGGGPWLLFLHGTFSNTLDSFGALPLRSTLWSRLRAAYGERILALEHRTLTTSPIENAAELARLLPEGVDLHLVSHSRGGLVGELLCRARIAGRDEPFDSDELALFAAPDRTAQEGALRDLASSLQRARPEINRFVRVACPARGTTLAAGRLDRWLNFVVNALGIGINVVASPLLGEIYDLVAAFLLAVIKERAGPGSVPGLEAMIPDSPLVRLLNRPGVIAAADLAVLEGDIKGAGILGRLKVLGTDLYFREDHDLVVNTSAMGGGMARSPVARSFFTQGPEVNHFAYFANPATAERVVEGVLRAADADGGFGAMVPAEARALQAPATRGDRSRPVVFLLPGITGSELCWKDRRIWVDLPQLASGGLRRLAIDAPDITARSPLSLYYGALRDYLDRSHDVRPWGYDWRRSILDTAKDFATDLNAALAGTDQPVRIVAHSMGGLVARSAFLDDRLWQRFKERQGARLIQLGTPNSGSWSIPFMLMGRNELMGYLAMLDITMSRREQQEIVTRFHGALQMLPHGEPTLFDAARWQALSQFDPGDEDWAPPSAADLAIAAGFRDRFSAAPVDPERMLYVAGQAPTILGIEEDGSAAPGERIRFRIGPEGDGQVPWATGIPPGIRAWYTDAAHGDLARHEPAFPAILELLNQGTTRRLPDRPPAVGPFRGAPATKTRDLVPQFPDAEDLILAGMGGRRRTSARGAAVPVRIRVVNGHLAFAHYPVMVGHYAGDTFAGTEAQLNKALDGRLEERRQRGLYAGPIDTNTVILDPGRRPRGAIVVGLGDPGSLAVGTLQRTVRQSILAYAAAEADRRRITGASLIDRFGLSTVLIGSGDAGLPRAACILALIRAVIRAQSVLCDGERRMPVLEEIELLELVEYRAYDIWHVLRRTLEERTDLAQLIELEDEVERRPGARRQISAGSDRDWWQPVQITMTDEPGSPEALNFTLAGGMARTESQAMAANLDVVRPLMARAIEGGSGDSETATPSRALFELLFPVPFKERSGDDRNLRLILDERSARFPWELMDDRRPWTSNGSLPERKDRKPPAVRSKIVRQLVQNRYREQVVVPRGSGKALVIGDPRGLPMEGFAKLPGAEAEAGAVAQLLGRNYDVTSLIGNTVTPEQVLMQLFAEAWEVIHIAAHGVVNEELPGPDGSKRRVTGVVLGGGVVLGPSVLAQLSVSPNLFFVNCCHLGAIDPDQEATARRATLAGHRPDLAASIAVALIRAGVRAVVAAGWAVDDDAAERFATTFYRSMLAGETFGTAAWEARSAAYDIRPGGTTWGAYQCYGEPDWRLSESGAVTDDERELHFVSLNEAVAAAEEIRESVQVGLDRDLAKSKRHLGAIEQACRQRSFFDEPELKVALAEAYAELGVLDKAIEYYDVARASERAAFSIRAIEQLANLSVRRAMTDSIDPSYRRPIIEGAIHRLTLLNATVGASAERHSLLGSCFKRLALVETGPARVENLKQAQRQYELAEQIMIDDGRGDSFYPALNYLTIELVLSIHNNYHIRKSISKKISRYANIIRDTDEASSFWQGIAALDLRLLSLLAQGKFIEEAARGLAEDYQSLYQIFGSHNKFDSVIAQIEFLAEMIKKDEGKLPDKWEDCRRALLFVSEALRRSGVHA